MRLIDADALKSLILRRRKEAKTLTAIDMVMVTDDQPTIDAVPVTRCRDCTRHKVEMINGAECWRCPLRELDVGPDYYCADGVRE